MPGPPIRIATISNSPDPNWAWLRDVDGADFAIAGRMLDWSNFNMAVKSGPTALGRFYGARSLARAHAQTPFDLVISHGPWVTAWTEWFGRRGGARHLAFSFNFTDLPTGMRKLLMKTAFGKVDAFAVFTNAEQELYANYFGISQDKLLRAPWGVAPPISTPSARPHESEYFAALGGEARDYGLLCEAARRCPDIDFVAVARPRNFEGVDAPPNLKVVFNLPFEEAWSVIWHAKGAIIPLRSRETPCGLVTLVGGMHLGKAQIVTDAIGVSEYVENDKTGLLTPAGDAGALAAAIRRLDNDPALAERLGKAASAYAGVHCSEAATVAFFRGLMEQWFGGD